jgi:hypothetical protein
MRRWGHTSLLSFVAAAVLFVWPGQAARTTAPPGWVYPKDAANGCPSVPPTPSFSIAYGTALLEGADAPVGTVVQAVNPRGDVAGCFEVTYAGHYGAMFVFGEDNSVQPPIPGMRPGETIIFRVAGLAASATPTLVWSNDHEVHEVALSASTPVPCYTLTTSASPAAGGSVSASPAPNCSGGRYTAGTQVQLTASAATGYSFSNWSGAISGSTNPTTLTMNGDRSVAANFSPICYTLTTSASPAAGGSVSASPAPNCSGGRYTAGTGVELSANPSAGYHFAYWSGDASGSTNPVTVTMDGDHSIAANFSQLCYTLSSSAGPPEGGSVNALPAPNCGESQYAAGTEVELSAVPSAGYYFAYWSGDVSGSANPVTVTMEGDRSVTANFSMTCYTLTTSAEPVAGGSADADPGPNCGVSQYAAGTQVQLLASAAPGFVFSHWSGDVDTSANPTSLIIDRDKTVVAHLRQVYSAYLPVTRREP